MLFYDFSNKKTLKTVANTQYWKVEKMGKNIVVLGGGVGGLVAANRLRKKLGEEHSVVMVDKKAQYEFTPSYPWLMLGWREPPQITRDLSRLSSKKIEYINAEVTGIDPENRLVKTSSKDLNYDYLVVSLGAELTPDALPGFSENAYNFYDMNQVEKLRDALNKFSSGTLTVLISSLPFKCPAAPYEAALLADYYLRKKGVRSQVDLQLYTPEVLPMPVARPVVGNAIKNLLEQRDIGFHSTMKAVSVDKKKKEITFEKGEKTRFDLIIGIPTHKAPTVVREAELTDQSGWVSVDKGNLTTRFDDLFAIGDVTAIKLPSRMMLPKAGVFAHREAEVVAHNIVADIEGTGTEKMYDGEGTCFLETGYGKAGFATGNFYSEPKPNIKMRTPSRFWHWSKILFEKYWLWRWF